MRHQAVGYAVQDHKQHFMTRQTKVARADMVAARLLLYHTDIAIPKRTSTSAPIRSALRASVWHHMDHFR